MSRRFLANVRSEGMFRTMRSPVLALAFLAAAATPAAATIGAWAEGDKARVRLLAGGTDSTGQLSAGIEIDLDMGWDTYWRSPGDSGIAPVIDFSASQNVKSVAVAFPPPERHDDGYAVTNVYEDRFILPVTIALTDPHAATHLALKLDIGVCEEVCIPAHFETAIDVAADAADPVATRQLQAAAALLPAPAHPGVFAIDKLWRDGGDDKKPGFSLAATLPDPANSEIFVEGPPDWYAGVPKLVSNAAGRATYHFDIDRLTAKTPITGTKLRITLVSGGKAVEQWIGLD
jgi:DsbC/DsbD-like thiol-disulfide interchange protein